MYKVGFIQGLIDFLLYTYFKKTHVYNNHALVGPFVAVKEE